METIEEQVVEARARALARGALLPLQMEVAEMGGEIPFSASWISSLSLKDLAKAAQAMKPGSNPFLPYEEDLFITDLSPTHLLLFNKFGIEEHHVMAITRAFVPQLAPLQYGDFHALATGLQALGGFAMFNGGRIGGASQAHRHLHFLPTTPLPLAAIFPVEGAPGVIEWIAPFRFVHAFVRIDDGITDIDARATHLQQLFEAACAHCGIATQANGELSPYNLLATERWLLLVPRRQELWQSPQATLQVSALNYGGIVGVREQGQLDVVRETGLLEILEAVSVPVG